jgi:hypothetical protein
MARRRRDWRIEGRERTEWNTALLAQVVLAAARARVASRRAQLDRPTSAPPDTPETSS